MFRLLCLIIGYGIGCVQTAYILCRLVGGVDIRQHGSGNAGATNVLRTLGPKAGFSVFTLDIIKGLVAAVLCSLIFGGANVLHADGSYLPLLYGGLGVVLGHCFPVYLGFKGGKGAASTIGVIMALNPAVALTAYITGILAVAVTKYVSLGALIVFTAFPGIMLLTGFSAEEIIIAAVICLLGYVQHRQNIVRLFKGQERKVSFRKK